MTEAELVKRLRKAADHAGMILTDPPRPTGLNSLMSEAADYITAQEAEIAGLRRDVERQSEALAEIGNWANAYPLKAFPEPDFAKARELLEAGGMTLDSVSASNMRHVVTEVAEIVRRARAST